MHNILGKGPLRRMTNAVVFRSEMNRVTELLDAKSPDVVHVFGYSPATMAAIQWAKFNNVPLIRELVNALKTPYQYPPGQFGNREFEFPNQTVVVAISEELGEVCNRFGLTENVWVRPNPVDISLFKPISPKEKAAAKEELFQFDADTRVVLYVAKFLERKNHSFLIDVLGKLPMNYRLVLAGPPLPDVHTVPGFTLQNIPKLILKAKQLEVADRLILRPEFVDFSEYIKAADVTCFPSEREGMGTPLLESLAAGVPVVANGGESSFREWITDGKNGFVPPLDASAWADAIRTANEFSVNQRVAMSKRVNEQISTDVIDEQYWKLLQTLNNSSASENLNVAEVLAN